MPRSSVNAAVPARDTGRISGTRQRSDSLRTRQQILRAASEMSRTTGFEHLRMADIAQHVGCARATVYNHFATRDDLLEALCTRYLDGYLEIVARVHGRAGADTTVFELLRETVAEELRWRVAHAELRGALDSAKRLRKDFYVRGDRRIDEAMLAWFGAIYGASARAGLLRPGIELEFATRTIYSMIDSVIAGFPVRTTPADISHVADQVARLQWHALYRGDPDRSPPFGNLKLDAPD